MIKIGSLTLETWWIKPVWTHRVSLWAVRSFQQYYLRSYKTKKTCLQIEITYLLAKNLQNNTQNQQSKADSFAWQHLQTWKHQSNFRTVLSTHNKPKKEHLIIHENTSNANQFWRDSNTKSFPSSGGDRDPTSKSTEDSLHGLREAKRFSVVNNCVVACAFLRPAPNCY